MANYSLVSTSKFEPFSFERYMQPLQIYANMYEKQEAALDALDEKASKWEMLANMAGNEESYKKYKGYADKLRAEADKMASAGLTPNSRRRIRELTSQYRSDVQPIEQAYNRWQELEKEQRIFSANNNFNVRYDNDYSQMRLDELIANPSQSYKAIKGEDVINRTAALAKQAMQAIISKPEITPEQRGLLLVKMQSGATLAQVEEAIKLGLDVEQVDDPVVKSLLQVAKTIDSGYQDNPAYEKDWMWKNISQGMYGGIGAASYSLEHDPSYSKPLEWANYNLSRRQLELQEDQWNTTKSFYTNSGDYSPGTTIVPGENGNPPRKVVVDEKGRVKKNQQLVPAQGKSGVWVDPDNGKQYDGKGQAIITNNGGGGGGKGANVANGSAALTSNSQLKQVRLSPVFWDAWDDSGRGYQHFGNVKNSYGTMDMWNIGAVTDANTKNKILKKSEVVDDVRTYIAQVTNQPKDKITPELARKAITEDKVVIYRDHDLFSDNHYFVAIKGVRATPLNMKDYTDSEQNDIRTGVNNLREFVNTNIGTANAGGGDPNALPPA